MRKFIVTYINTVGSICTKTVKGWNAESAELFFKNNFSYSKILSTVQA